MIVLDASALLALLLKEHGHERVAERLSGSLISAVNYSEVLARVARLRIAPDALHPRLTELGMSVVSFDEQQAVVAAQIREIARAAGLGLADCCCVALALTKQLPVMTADRIWKTLGFELDVVLIR